MSKLPFMPFFVGDYISDTAELSLEAHGAYCLILFYSWKKKDFLPDDDAHLKRVLRVHGKTWNRVKSELSPFFDLSDGVWFHPKLAETLEKSQRKNEVNRENGKSGGRPKSLKNNKTDNPNGSLKKTILEPELEPERKKEDRAEQDSPSIDWGPLRS